MTNEHAIWLLQHRADESGGEIHEAYVMAIKALSQEPKTQMVDKSNFDVNQYKVDIDTAYECGKASERQTGKWIYRREDKYSCSKCGTTTRVDEGGIDEKPMYKFCPYCGACMKDGRTLDEFIEDSKESEDKE